MAQICKRLASRTLVTVSLRRQVEKQPLLLLLLQQRSLNTTCCQKWQKHKPGEEYEKSRYLKLKQDTDIASAELFEAAKEKDQNTFKGAIDIFKNRDARRRGSVEFINAALKHMKQFGVHRNLSVYKALIDVMPKGVYVPTNRFQVEYKHYPKQQDCMVDLLLQMELNKVIPDEEVGELLKNIYGRDSGPYKRYARMIYWMPKFKNLSPWPLPFELPNEAVELAKLAVEQITSVDRLTEIKVLDTSDIADSVDKTWIVSGQSPSQKDIIKHWPKKKALFVEGGFRIWLKDAQVIYYILRGETRAYGSKESTVNIEDVNKVPLWIWGEVADTQDLVPLPLVHEQDDGTILGVCATGTSSKDSLLSWIRFIQKDNPSLEKIPILFTLHSPLGPVVPLSEEELNSTQLRPKQ